MANDDIIKNSDKSLIGMLEENAKNGCVPFCMPGHKRQEFDFLRGAQKFDITEIDGFDNLHSAIGVLKDASERASRVFGSLHTRLLVNGSTCGILAGIRSVCRQGDSILIARNCHKSVFNAVEICGLDVNYVLPKTICNGSMFGGVSAQDVDDALQNCKAKLVVITSPTYEGVISDIKSLAEACHKNGALLFVDEAHGAHLGFGKFEKSARSLGADIVVNSVHKTLPSLTQTALLHVCSDRVDINAVDRNLAIFESSSPSYLLMSSIDGCVRYVEKEGALDVWSDAIDNARESLQNLLHIKLLDGSLDNMFAYDKSKFVLVLDKCNLNGVEFANELRARHIEVEMASANYVICMSGAGDNYCTMKALVDAVKDVDLTAETSDTKVVEVPHILPQKEFNPCKIDLLNAYIVNFDENCIGRISAENVWAYPPGSPVIVKGERIEKAVYEHLSLLRKNNVNLSSESKRFPSAITVVKGSDTIL